MKLTVTFILLLLNVTAGNAQNGWSTSDGWSTSESETDQPISAHLDQHLCSTSWTEDTEDQSHSVTEAVVARQRSTKSVNQHLLSEVSTGKKMKCKVLNVLSVQSALKETCSCDLECHKEVTFGIIRTLRSEFWSHSRPLRLQILTQYISTATCSGRFSYIKVDKYSLCSKMFRVVFHVNKNLYSKALGMIRMDQIAPVGKNTRVCNSESLMCLNWMEDYFTYHGERMPNTAKVILPYGTIKNDLYVQNTNRENRGPLHATSRSQFYKLWKEHFPNVKAKKTNSFTKCTTCVTLERQMGKTTCPYTRALYRKQKEEHNNRQMMERKYYYGKREAARKNPSQFLSIIIDGMDQAKTNLPHFTGRRPKNLNPMDLLKTHLTGVINHGHGGFHSYIDLKEYPHDPNLTINVLLKVLHQTARTNGNTLPPVLYIQADNCWRENKNRYVLSFCELIVTEHIFNEVHLSFLYVGHTHEDIDATFSTISEKLRKQDAETLDDFLTLLGNVEMLDNLFDVKDWLRPNIAAVSKITQPLHYKFELIDNTVHTFYKGQEHQPWTELDENFLLSKPEGHPTVLLPNYSEISIENNLKQVETLTCIFKNRNSILTWKHFYNNLEDRRNNCPPEWTLPELPRQVQAQPRPTMYKEVVPEVIELMEKETRIPQLKVQKRNSRPHAVEDAQNTKKSKTVTAKVSKRGAQVSTDRKKPSRRKQVRVYYRTTSMLIPLNGDEKRHIWFMILMDILQQTYMILHLFLMIVYFVCMHSVMYMLTQLFAEILILLYTHVGLYNASVGISSTQLYTSHLVC